MKRTITLIILLFLSYSCYSQQIKRDIQRLKIKDTVLLQQLNIMINGIAIYGGDYKSGYGYIELHIEQFAGSADTAITYSFSPSLLFLDEKATDDLYPDYYDFVDNKLVTIYIDALDRYHFSNKTLTDKSKKMIRTLTDKYLEKAGPMIKIKEKTVLFRSQTFTSGGTKIYILRNKPPIIRKVMEY